MAIEIRGLELVDGPRVAHWVAERWGSEIVVVHGAVYRPAELPGNDGIPIRDEIELEMNLA